MASNRDLRGYFFTWIIQYFFQNMIDTGGLLRRCSSKVYTRAIGLAATACFIAIVIFVSLLFSRFLLFTSWKCFLWNQVVEKLLTRLLEESYIFLVTNGFFGNAVSLWKCWFYWNCGNLLEPCGLHNFCSFNDIVRFICHYSLLYGSFFVVILVLCCLSLFQIQIMRCLAFWAAGIARWGKFHSLRIENQSWLPHSSTLWISATYIPFANISQNCLECSFNIQEKKQPVFRIVLNVTNKIVVRFFVLSSDLM